MTAATNEIQVMTIMVSRTLPYENLLIRAVVGFVARLPFCFNFCLNLYFDLNESVFQFLFKFLFEFSF